MHARHAVIVGAGGHAVSVAETVRSAGLNIIAFVSEAGPAAALLGHPVVPAVPDGHVEDGGVIVIAIGDNTIREQVWARLRGTAPLASFPSVCHASSIIAEDVSLAPGSVVLQGAIVGSGAAVGAGALINTGAILDHESVMEDFSSLAPRAVTGGRVRIGARSAVSIGAVIRHNVTLGRDTVVGAGAYVHRDLPDEVVAYGVPARIVRSRSQGDPYLG
jgi:sugar O-acyltransferase (sialic acid O-acetyltransferase NeuD family)